MKQSYNKSLKKVAHFQVEHPWITVFLIFSLTIAIYGGVGKVRTVASLEQMMPKDVEEIMAFNALRDNKLGQDMIAVVLEVDRDSTVGILDIRDKEIYDYVKQVSEFLANEVDIIQVYSFSTLLENAEMSDQEYVDSLLRPEMKDFFDEDYTTTMIIANTDVSADDPRMSMLSKKIRSLIDDSGHPPGISVSLTGTPIIQQRLGELISSDRENTTWLSTLLVFLIIMLTFGTLTSAFVPILVVTTSVTWLYGTMGYLDLPISTLAGGVAAMVIGIGIDYAIHIMNKFKYERKKGMDIKEAIEAAVIDTGTALTATSLTTIAAFLAFLIGQMPEMGRFGLLMAIGITYSLMFSIFGLPAVLVLEEVFIYRAKDKMKFGLEGEFRLEEENDRRHR